MDDVAKLEADAFDEALKLAKNLDFTVDPEVWERYQAEAEELFRDAQEWAESLEFSDAIKCGK